MSVREFLQDNNVPMAPDHHHHRTHGFEVQVDCPYCSPDSHRYRMGLAATHASCWQCGSKPIVETLNLLTGLHWQKVREFLKGVPGHAREGKKPKGLLELPYGLGPLQVAHRKYLVERGFNPDKLAKLWGLQGIGLSPTHPWRIFIPVFRHGETVSWTTRSLSADGIRYKSAEAGQEAVSMKEVLYGGDLAGHTALICEGPVDAWAIGPGAVAILGLAYSTAQLLLMSKFPRRVIAFDNEINAQKRARKLCRDLSVFPGETHCLTFSCKDAAETLLRKPKEIREARKRFLE